jgi:hypothetical protein
MSETTFYIPPPTHKRLKEIALARSTSLQQLLEEAVGGGRMAGPLR